MGFRYPQTRQENPAQASCGGSKICLAARPYPLRSLSARMDRFVTHLPSVLDLYPRSAAFSPTARRHISMI